MLAPPTSSGVRVFSDGLIAASREASTKGPWVDGRRETTVPFPLGEVSGEPTVGPPLVWSGVGGGLMRLGWKCEALARAR